MLFAVKCAVLKYMFVYFQDLNKQTSKIDVLKGEIRLPGEEKIIHVCLCVGGGGLLTIFYSPQAPIKRVWNPFFPNLCESLCKRQIHL